MCILGCSLPQGFQEAKYVKKYSWVAGYNNSPKIKKNKKGVGQVATVSVNEQYEQNFKRLVSISQGKQSQRTFYLPLYSIPSEETVRSFSILQDYIQKT